MKQGIYLIKQGLKGVGSLIIDRDVAEDKYEAMIFDQYNGKTDIKDIPALNLSVVLDDHLKNRFGNYELKAM